MYWSLQWPNGQKVVYMIGTIGCLGLTQMFVGGPEGLDKVYFLVRLGRNSAVDSLPKLAH